MTELRNYSVYMHTNKTNKKRYIGITSMKPKYRWNNGKGYKKNDDFFNDIIKYGWDNFEHIVIANGLTEAEARLLEAQLILIFRSADKNRGYNKHKNTGRLQSAAPVGLFTDLLEEY